MWVSRFFARHEQECTGISSRHLARNRVGPKGAQSGKPPSGDHHQVGIDLTRHLDQYGRDSATPDPAARRKFAPDQPVHLFCRPEADPSAVDRGYGEWCAGKAATGRLLRTHARQGRNHNKQDQASTSQARQFFTDCRAGLVEISFSISTRMRSNQRDTRYPGHWAE